MKTNNPLLLLALGATLPLTLAACTGGQRVEEEVIVETVVELDIPGVAPAALDAYYDGVRAMNETPRNYEAALGFFEAAVAADPDFWEAYENIGLLQMDLGRPADAIRTFEREMTLIDELIARSWPVDARPELQLSYGKALALAGRTNEAALAFNALLETDPGNVEALANLASLNYDAGNYDVARQFAGQLLEISRNDPGALSVLALVAKAEGDMQMARFLWEKTVVEIDSATRALEAENTAITEAIDAGNGFDGLSVEDSERRRVRNTHRIDRLRVALGDVQNELGLVAASEGNFDQAELLFRLATQNNTSNEAAYLNLGAVYLDFANFADACTAFGEALALRPADEAGLIGFGACLYGQGDVDGAYAAFQNAARFHDDNEYVASRLGFIAWQDLNDLAAATEWFTRSLNLMGMDPASCDRVAVPECGAVESIRVMQSMEPREPVEE